MTQSMEDLSKRTVTQWRTLLVMSAVVVLLSIPQTSMACSKVFPGCGNACMHGPSGRWAGPSCGQCGVCIAALTAESATAVAMLVSKEVAEAAGNTVVLKDPDPRPSWSGVMFDLQRLEAVVDTHAAVALLLLYFHPDYFLPDQNLLRGAASYSGMPTRQSFELAKTRVDVSTIQASFEPTTPDRFVLVRWESVIPDGQDIFTVTFHTELIDEDVIVKQVLAPPLTVTVSHSQKTILSFERSD